MLHLIFDSSKACAVVHCIDLAVPVDAIDGFLTAEVLGPFRRAVQKSGAAMPVSTGP